MMINYTGSYIREERVKKNLNTAQLARKMGYKNVSKGMNRIIDLERNNIAHPEIMKKLICALALDDGCVDSLIQKDRLEYEGEFEKWVSQPIRMHYIERYMPTIYLRHELPGNIKTEEEALNYTAKIAKEKGHIIWLVLSRKEKIFINEEGKVIGKIETKPYSEVYPYSTVM